MSGGEVGFDGFKGRLEESGVEVFEIRAVLLSCFSLEVFGGEVEAMEAGEVFEEGVEVGNGFAAAEFDEDMVFDCGKDGEESGAGAGAMECLGEYAGQFGVRFEFTMGGVEPAEGGG